MQKTALLIDDDPDQLLVLKLFLERVGFRVSTARSGAHGLRIADEGLPSVLVCDLRMPEMDGFETVRRFREKEGSVDARIPVIVLTASPNVEQQALDAGADFVCLKRAATGDLKRILSGIFKR